MVKARAEKLAQLEPIWQRTASNRSHRLPNVAGESQSQTVQTRARRLPGPYGKVVKRYRIGEGLGWGVLLVMLVDVISNT